MNQHLKELAEQTRRFAERIQQLILIDFNAPDADVQMTAHIADCRDRLQMFEILFDEMERDLGGASP
jgi:hypothetical protein